MLLLQIFKILMPMNIQKAHNSSMKQLFTIPLTTIFQVQNVQKMGLSLLIFQNYSILLFLIFYVIYLFSSILCNYQISLIIDSHSFAYDCRRYFNICVADRETIIFVSGNLIHFFNVVENKIWFRRCSTGGGIGHIAVNIFKINIFVVHEV